MNASGRNKSKSNRKTARCGGEDGNRTGHRQAPRAIWPALVAINGFGFAVNHASALELGDVTVQSALGQPLRASIAYALAPNEMIQSHCIFLRPAASTAGFPTVRNATASASNGVIRLTGSVPIREPILNLNLMVDCPGTANLSRQYTLFVDPSTGMTAPPAATVAERAPASVRRTEPAPRAQRPARPAADNTASIGASRSYRVQPGDTLSGIAARIEDRDISIWEAVDVIFAANPDAFIGNDRNRLRAGSVLVLPDMGSVSPAAAPARTAATPAQDNARATTTVTTAAAVTTTAPDAATPVAGAATTPVVDAAGTAGEPAVPAEATAVSDNPFVTPAVPGNGTASGTFAPAREVIPDTAVDTVPTRVAPRVSVAQGDDGEGLSSLAWLGGTGIALILGLLLFGRQLKERFGSPGDILPAGIKRGRRRNDAESEAQPETQLADDEPTDTFESPVRVQPVAVDADLGTGSGFDDDGEIDVAQDFGFSTSRDLGEDLDIVLTEEDAREPANVIPPERFGVQRFTDTLIVEKEVPPSDETGEYDLSMIVDATKQPIAEFEDTTKDLRAVQVDTADNETLGGDNLTLSRQVDYKILEQDYEDELTATQALNAKILKEAELAAQAESLDATANSESPNGGYAVIDDDLTMQLPQDDLEPTAEMPRDQEPTAEAPIALEDSGVNAEVTTELLAADNDESLDVDVETRTIDTKKLRAS